MNHDRLVEALKAPTNDHCSFCDVHPVKPPSDEPIEHFRPKAKFPLLAWQWENLFYCCRCCNQSKGEKWDDRLLKPDQEGYAFGRYFMADFTTGEIKPLEGLTETDRQRAEITIRFYSLNDPTHQANRRKVMEWRSELRHRPIDEFSYRDFIEAGELANNPTS